MFGRMMIAMVHRRVVGCMVSLLASGVMPAGAAGAAVTVHDARGFVEAVRKAKPGTVVEAADGEYRFDDQVRITLSGTEEKPILIRAKNTGKAVIAGDYSIDCAGCSYVTVEGFVFTCRARDRGVIVGLETPRQGVVGVYDSDHCRLTRLYFELEEKAGFSPEQVVKRLPRQHWVNFTGGSFNRIDHCRFRNKNNHGITLFVDNGERHIRIDHNHFDTRPPGYENGFETLRLGTGNGRYNTWSVIEDNLFENCDGESEIVSFKSNEHIFRHNTILDSKGQIVVRAGNRVKIEGNFFINTDPKKPGVGGIRLHGCDCTVFDNYFHGLTGAGLSTNWGDFEVSPVTVEDDHGPREEAYRRAVRCYILLNTWVDCARFLDLGKQAARSNSVTLYLPPKDWVIQNNLVQCRGDVFVGGEGEVGFRWLGNIFWNSGGPAVPGRDVPEAGIAVKDPKLVLCGDGLYRLSAESPARNAALGWLELEMVDMDGQERKRETKPDFYETFALDVGADEYSDEPVRLRPLKPADVGPFAP